MKKKQTIIPPEGGWKPQTVYLVEVSFNHQNPIHRALFKTGFLNGPKNGPGGYNELWGRYERTYEIHQVYYMKAIREVCSEEDFRMPESEDSLMPPEPEEDIAENGRGI